MAKKMFRRIAAACLTGALCIGGWPVCAHAAEYQGIEIDGNFSDWDAVHKTEVNDGKLNRVAFVFDGDRLYFYLDAAQNYTAGMASDTNNGKYAVTTDLGYTMLFQMTNASSKPEISGVNGAEIAYSDLTYGLDSYIYEFSIPATELPEYLATVSFGAYLGETYVYDIANLQGSDATGSNFSGIIFDGEFVDWSSYPHSLIYYAGSGTHENNVDAEGALYLSGDYLYGHVYTTMQAHLNSNGGDLTSGITIGINDLPDKDTKYGFWPKKVFYPQFITVDAQGNINYSPQLSGLSMGTHEFYLIDAGGWKSATNVAQWENPSETYIYGTNHVYGKAKVVIGASRQEMEFILSVDLLAQDFSMEPEEMHSFCAQFGRLGQQWISTAGTSTGPWVGVAVCIGSTGVVLLGRKRKKRLVNMPAA